MILPVARAESDSAQVIALQRDWPQSRGEIEPVLDRLGLAHGTASPCKKADGDKHTGGADGLNHGAGF